MRENGIVKLDVIDAEEFAIALRRHGCSAWVERENGRDFVFARRSFRWVRSLCRRNIWMAPDLVC